MDNTPVMVGGAGFVLGYLVGSGGKPVDDRPEVIRRLQIFCATKLLSPKVVANGIVGGKKITTYLYQEADGNTQAVVDVYGSDFLQVTRLTGTIVYVHFDGVLKYTFPYTTGAGVVQPGYVDWTF